MDAVKVHKDPSCPFLYVAARSVGIASGRLPASAQASQASIVEAHGRLGVIGNKVVDESLGGFVLYTILCNTLRSII